MQTTVATHIEIRPNRAGQNRSFVAGTRVRVSDIYALAEVQGFSPDEIAGQLPHLTLGQVHAALSYFFDHRDEILEEIRVDRQFAEQTKARTGPGPLEMKLGDNPTGNAVSP